MNDQGSLRDFGSKWKERLEQTRNRAANPGPRLSDDEIAKLRHAAATLDISSPANMAFLWSGKDIPTGMKMDETAADSPYWWDKLACYEAEVFRKLHIGLCLEDTPGGGFLIDAGLHYPEDDPLSTVVRDLWDVLSTRFVQAAAGRIEIIGEGAFESGVLRTVELSAVLANDRITAVNGLDRALLPSDANDAYALLRRWDVERSRRYHQLIASAPDATDPERAAALDDFRECQLWYEMDFFAQLGPQRKLPDLPVAIADAADQAKDAGAWKYSAAWRTFVRQEGQQQGAGS